MENNGSNGPPALDRPRPRARLSGGGSVKALTRNHDKEFKAAAQQQKSFRRHSSSVIEGSSSHGNSSHGIPQAKIPTNTPPKSHGGVFSTITSLRGPAARLAARIRRGSAKKKGPSHHEGGASSTNSSRLDRKPSKGSSANSHAEESSARSQRKSAVSFATKEDVGGEENDVTRQSVEKYMTGAPRKYMTVAPRGDAVARPSAGNRRATRRARNTGGMNTVPGKRGHTCSPFQTEGLMKIRRGNTHLKTTLTADPSGTGDTLCCVLLKTLMKDNLCDVELVGKDEVPVQVPSYLLAAHSMVFENMLFPENNDGQPASPSSGGGGKPPRCSTSEPSRPGLRRVDLAFGNWDSINAAIEFLVQRSLPEGLEHEPNEGNMRTICQMHLIGRVFHVPSLESQAYRTARLFMNKTPRLVCVTFDECLLCENLLGEEYALPTCQDELSSYALEYLRESPLTTLLADGTPFLSAESIEAILSDQEIDIDETTMFSILNKWVMHDEEGNLEKGRALVSNIDLACVQADYLKNTVRRCKFVDGADVNAALKEIEETLANLSPDEQEHVLVEGAGKADINGIYVRMKEDIGLGENEIVYVKECGEDEEYCPDYGLYLMHGTWAITPCVDYSNYLYKCEVDEDFSPSRNQAPAAGWETDGGVDPPPRCTWNASKEDTNDPSKKNIAPSLMDAKIKKSVMDSEMGDHDEGTREMSLSSMCNLPTDEGHEDDDYHDDLDATDTSKDALADVASC